MPSGTELLVIGSGALLLGFVATLALAITDVAEVGAVDALISGAGAVAVALLITDIALIAIMVLLIAGTEVAGGAPLVAIAVSIGCEDALLARGSAAVLLAVAVATPGFITFNVSALSALQAGTPTSTATSAT